MYSTRQQGKKPQKYGNHFCYSLGKKWYRLLVPKHDRYTVCLLNDHPEPLNQKLVVGFETPPRKGDENHSRLYALFNSYVELFTYQCHFRPDQRYFYEIIMGDLPQKPHFDIDIKVSDCPEGKDLNELGNEVKNGVIANILHVGEENGVTFSLEKDILVYTSHGEKKRSYHIIIHHHCHSNHEQAKAFYKAVNAKMVEENRVFVDHSVYSSKQNFRLVGSQKIGSYRPKKFCEVYSFGGKEIKHVYDVSFRSEEHKRLESFKISLISWVSECEYLPSFQDDYQRERYFKEYVEEDYGDLSDGTIEEAIQILDDTRKSLVSKFPFEVREVKGNIISLRRLRPSWCNMCGRSHEHENPYIMIVGNDLHFCCRRSNSGSEILGTLTKTTPSLKTGLLELSSDTEEDGMELHLGNYKASLHSLVHRGPQKVGPLLVHRGPQKTGPSGPQKAGPSGPQKGKEKKSRTKPILHIIPKEDGQDVLERLRDLGLNQHHKPNTNSSMPDQQFRKITRSIYLKDMKVISMSTRSLY